MKGHIGDRTEFGHFGDVSRCKRGHLRQSGFGSRDLCKAFAEIFKARGSATEVSPCLGGGAQEHTNSLFPEALQREYRQRDLQGFKVMAMVKKLAIHVHLWLHSFILWLFEPLSAVNRSMLVTAPVQE